MRWALFDDDTRFIYMAIFDTDFDKCVEDVLTLFKRVESAGVIPLFASHRRFPSGLEGESRRIREVGSRGPCPIFRRICVVSGLLRIFDGSNPDTTGVEVVKRPVVKQAHSRV